MSNALGIPSAPLVTKEIERRFLVPLDPPLALLPKRTAIHFIEQTYLPGTGDWQIRSRKTTFDGQIEYRLTMKRHVSIGECDEIELPGNLETHQEFIATSGQSLKKGRTKHLLPCGAILEFDIYDEKSLIHGYGIAEIELETLDQPVILPNWIGREITGEKELSNHALYMQLMGKEERQPS